MLWAVIDIERKMKYQHRFYIYGTGHEHDFIHGKHIKTVQLDNGLVFHIFDGME